MDDRKLDLQKIKDLIRSDLLTMSGGKNTSRNTCIAGSIFAVALGFAASPLFGLYAQFIVAGFFVPTLFGNELKYQSGRMYSILPIRRKDLVRARFILSVGFYLLVSLAFYLLMLLAFKLETYRFLMTNDGQTYELIHILAEHSGVFTPMGLFNLIYAGAFSFGLTMMTGSLRNYFKDSKLTAITQTTKKLRKKDYLMLGGMIGVILLWILIAGGIIPLGTAAVFAAYILLQLAGAADGFLLGSMIIMTGVLGAVYRYIATVLEYDEKEL